MYLFPLIASQLRRCCSAQRTTLVLVVLCRIERCLFAVLPSCCRRDGRRRRQLQLGNLHIVLILPGRVCPQE